MKFAGAVRQRTGRRGRKNNELQTNDNMKRTLMVIPLLALLAGAPALLTSCATSRAGDSTQAAAKPYPLNYCLVSGDKIGEMGEPVKLVYKGQEFKFCCKDCVKDFNKDPDKFMQKLAEAEQKAK